MGDTAGFLRFPAGNLDPAAQEFIPVSHLPVHVFYPYPQHHYFAPPPPPPPPYPPTSFFTSVSLPPTRSMPSRTLLLSMVPVDVSESTVRRELEVFGDVRAVQMERLRDGIVTVHFYDLRQAQAALVEIQEQHMQQQYRLRRHHDAVLAMNYAVFFPPSPPPARGLVSGRAVWAQFTSPVTSSLPDGNNQGTLVIFNLDPRVGPTILRQIFQAFGEVKELRETPRKRHQRFVEFYDVRDAARALIEMNNKEIHGRNIVIEFSRPGGHGRKYSSSSKPKPPYSLGIIPAGMPSPLVRQASGRWVANPEYFDKKDATNTSGEFSSNSSGGSVENSMAALSLGVGPRSSSTTSSGGSTSKQNRHNHHHKNRSKAPFKGSSSTSSRRSKVDFNPNPDPDPRFSINEDVTIESNSMDSRTTVMIKNIPNKYSQKLLLNMLDNHCIHSNEQIGDDDDKQPHSSYDFVYLPIDFSNKCNVGYGFVNMTSPEATLRLHRAFHRQSWEVFNSRKICEVTYARLQGLEALKEHFKNSKFPYEVDEYMPVMFSPPRDGRRLTEPVTVSARFVGPRIKCSWSSSEEGNNGAVNGDGDGDGDEDDGNRAGCSGGAGGGRGSGVMT